MLDSHRRRRPLRVAVYLTLAAGNFVILTDPTQSFRDVPFSLRFVWNGMMLAGCLSAVFGAWRDRYLFEFVGLPLILAGLGAFILVLFLAWSTGPLAFACFLSCLSIVLVSRELDLWDLVQSSIRAERRRK